MTGPSTIFALATAPGKSGIAAIRISGPAALPALRTLTGRDAFEPRRVEYVKFAAIDRGLAIYFNAPHSFTGEDVVELHTHGSLAVIRELLDVLSDMDGLCPAEPGEFTRRAFLNGKMDLTEAEGLADLIAAETSQQRTQAMRQMEGALGQYYEELRTQVIYCLAQLEAYIDFPDEDIPDSVLSGLAVAIEELKKRIQEALADHHRGERVREGIHIVILGAPNAGKSSLLNVLSKKDAAIVSVKAGTTRDVIETHLDIAGYPVILVDTAGIRESSDEIEEEGVRRALARAQTADIKLVLFDAGELPALNPASLALMDDQTISILSKCDKIAVREGGDMLFLSTQTGEGVEKLMDTIKDRITSFFSGASAPFITRNRHRALLTEALACLNLYKTGAPLELSCEELRQAAQSIGKITGKIAVDDVLDVVFRQFCIGK